jgi:hypothetical protein
MSRQYSGSLGDTSVLSAMMKTRHTSFSNSPDAAVSRRVLLANPRGFCAGVDRAIEAVGGAVEPVFVSS